MLAKLDQLACGKEVHTPAVFPTEYRKSCFTFFFELRREVVERKEKKRSLVMSSDKK